MSDADIKKFEGRLIEERDKLRRGFTITITAYVVIALAISVYAIIVFKGFKDMVGPQGMGEQFTSYINMASHAPQQLDSAYQKNKDELATLVVNRALEVIPEVEGLIKTQLDSYNADIKLALTREVMPNFRAYMKESIPDLKAKLAEMRKTRPDATIGMVLARAFVDYLEEESARLIKEDEVIDQANRLQRDLLTLQRVNAPISRKDLATRKLLISFILISRLDIEGSPMLEEFHKFLEKRFGVTAQEIRSIDEVKVIEDDLNDVEDDHPQEELKP